MADKADERHISRDAQRKADKAAFLEHLGRRRRFGEACAHIKRSRQALYNWRAKDAAFAAAWDDALAIKPADVLHLHASAFDRAADGWMEPVYFKGKVVGAVRRYSSYLTKIMLEAHVPDLFRSNLANATDENAQQLADLVQIHLARMKAAMVVGEDDGHGGNGNGRLGDNGGAGNSEA